MLMSFSLPDREHVMIFLRQHILLFLSLYLMTLGVALNVRSDLGSSVISAIPLSFSDAGADGLAPELTIGGYTNIMNVLLVVAQILVLRRRYEKVQLFQLVIGFLFGTLIDINMYLTSFADYGSLLTRVGAQLGGCTVLALGIAAEVKCGSVMMPGEGITMALKIFTGVPFARMKIYVDVALVVLAVASCFIFWGEWRWNVIGPGTLFAMFYVGMLVRLIMPHMGWFDRLLNPRRQ